MKRDHKLAVLLLLIGAAHSEAQPVDVELGFDRPARLEWVTGDAVEIEWLAVEDSRCAEGVECVWEGEVSVSLAVTVNNAPADTVDITLHAGDEDEATALVQGMYDIQVAGVEPYPVIDVVPERSAYRARLVVSHRRTTAVEAQSWGIIKRRLDSSR